MPENIGYIILIPVIILLLVVNLRFKAKKRASEPDYTEEFNELIDEANAAIETFYSVYRKAAAISWIDHLDVLEIESHAKDYEKKLADLQYHLDLLAEAINQGRSKAYAREKANVEGIIKMIHSMSERITHIQKTAEIKNAVKEEYYRHHTGYQEEYILKENDTEEDMLEEMEEPEGSGYFCTCHTKSELKKKYRELAKFYHPDMPSGDVAMFRAIQREYEERLKGYEK